MVTAMKPATVKDYLLAAAIAALIGLAVAVDNQGMTPAEVRAHP